MWNMCPVLFHPFKKKRCGLNLLKNMVARANDVETHYFSVFLNHMFWQLQFNISSSPEIVSLDLVYRIITGLFHDMKSTSYRSYFIPFKALWRAIAVVASGSKENVFLFNYCYTLDTWSGTWKLVLWDSPWHHSGTFLSISGCREQGIQTWQVSSSFS